MDDKYLTDKELWIIVRRALLLIVSAIEKKYALKNGRVIEPTNTDTVATWQSDK